MAIGHIAIRSHSRAKSHTAAAALAYRCGARLRDTTGAIHDYSRRARADVAATGIAAPHGTPIATDLQTLADAVEAAERRRDSQIGRDFQPALPAELSETEGIELVGNFANALSERYTTAAVWAVHRPDKRGDGRNQHGHIWLPTRAVDEAGGFGRKLVELQSPKTSGAEVRAVRKLWEDFANAALQRAGQNARVDTGRRRDGRPAQPTIPRECVAIERQAAAETAGENPLPGMGIAALCAALEDVDPAGCATDTGRELAAYTAEHGRTQTPETPETVWPRRRRSVRDGTRRPRRRNRVRAPLPTGMPTRAERDVRELTSALADVERRLEDARTAQEAHTGVDAPSPSPVPVASPATPPAGTPVRTGFGDVADIAAHFAAQNAPSPTEDPPVPVRTGFGDVADIATHSAARDTGRDAPSPSEATPMPPDDDHPLRPILDEQEQEQRQENEQMPDNDIAKARRRRGPDVEAHADTHDIESTPAEKRRARAYLAGSNERPSLPAALDETVAARLSGEPEREELFAFACRSPDGAATANRLTHATVDAFEDEHRDTPRANLLTLFLDQWKTLRRSLLRKIVSAVVPLDIQFERNQRAGRFASAIRDSAARRPDRDAVRVQPIRKPAKPPDPDFSMKPAAKPSSPASDTAPAQHPSGPDVSM